MSDTTLEMDAEEQPSAGIVFEDAPPGAVADPDAQALAETQNGLREREAALAREREARVAAEREGQTARDRLAQVEAARLTERKAALQSDLDAAKTARDMAQQAYRAAREAGDIDGELNAQELLTGAISNIRDVERQLAAAPELPRTDRVEPPRQAPPQQPQVMSAASRQWIADHPRFDSDPVYKQATITAHMQAVQAGIPVDSPEYFQHIEGRLALMFDEPTSRRPPERSTAAPPSRGDQGAAANRTVDTVFGPLRVSKGTTGPLRIGFANQQQRDNMTEAARFNGFVDKHNKVDLGGYCKSLIENVERNGGGPPPITRL